MPKALIRCEAGTEIGFGHAVRCAAVAARLHRAGWEVGFAISEAAYRRVPDLAAFEIVPIDDLAATAADLVILDLLTPDFDLEQKLARQGRRVLVIDDAPEHPHLGRWLVDTTPGRTAADYSVLAPEMIILTGPRFAPIRESLRLARTAPESRAPLVPPESILIAFGGSDPSNRTLVALESLIDLSWEKPVKIVLGAEAPFREVVETACRNLRHAETLIAPPDMADLYLWADLVIGGAGTSSWERCCLGRPTVVLPVVESQQEWADRLQALGVAVTVAPDRAALTATLQTLLAAPERLRELADTGRSLVDGRGADRLLLALAPNVPILDGRLRLRLLEANDKPLIDAWRQDPATRPFTHVSSHAEAPDTWTPADLDSPDRLLLIASASTASGDIDVAFVRLDKCATPVQGWEVMIATAPDHARRGIGRAALRLLAQLMPSETFLAHIPAGNDASQGFFRALGYVPISEEWYRSNHSRFKDQ